MNETSLSLLHRLRDSAETETWNRLVELYTPLLQTWVRRYGVQPSDADDLTQEVLLAVAKDLPGFDHSGRPGAFRAWLKEILLNRLRAFWRSRDRGDQARGEAESQLAQLEDPTSEMSQIWNRQHDQYVLRQLLSLVEPHFRATTWKAFCRVALDGVKADLVAAELDISLNSVFIAKSRVLSRLRQEAEGLIESTSLFFSGR